MLLTKLALSNFRNFPKGTFYFNPFLTIVIGNNSVGKTNLLEAIYFICRSSGFRESKHDELILNTVNQSDVEAEFTNQDEVMRLRIVMTKDQSPSKYYLVDKAKKRSFDYLNVSPLVSIFSPSFMYIIDGEPKSRRSFFDRILEKIDIEYRTRLNNYENGLRKRNKLLEKSFDKEKLREELTFWDDYLIEQAVYIEKKREELVNFYNAHNKIDSITFTLVHKPNEISADTLTSTFDRQFYVKKTLVGPQRDEYEIVLNRNEESKNVHHFGSRSEQRFSLLWLIINELKIFQEKLNRRPILLLDDIFSEFDVANRALVLDLIKKYQTVLTTTEKESLDLIEIPNTIIPLP